MSYQGASNFRRLRGEYFGDPGPQSPATGPDPAGYPPAPGTEDPAAYQAAGGFQGAPGYLGATGRLQRPAGQVPAGPAAAGYPGTAYQDPAAYQPTATYQDPGGWPAPAGYADPNAGFPDPAAGFPDRTAGFPDPNAGFADPTAYQGLTGPPFTGTASYDRPDTGGWPRAAGAGASRGRGILVGATAGFLAGATAICVAILAAAFVRPQASPVIAVGGAAIDRTPSALKQFAIQYFGQNDKNVLLLGMYVVIAMLAMAVGLLAGKRLAVGVAGMAAFGAFGAFVAITRPEGRVTDGIPSLIGGAAGVAALVLLMWAAAPGRAAALPRRARGPRDGYHRTTHASAGGMRA
jgi:hypothetical protein